MPHSLGHAGSVVSRTLSMNASSSGYVNVQGAGPGLIVKESVCGFVASAGLRQTISSLNTLPPSGKTPLPGVDEVSVCGLSPTR